MINTQVSMQPLKTKCLLIAAVMVMYSVFIVDKVIVVYKIKHKFTGSWDNIIEYTLAYL